MIGPHQLMIGLSCGAALLLVGLLPGLFRHLVDGVQELHNLLSAPWAPRRESHVQPAERSYWIAIAGICLIAAAIALYLSDAA